MKKVKVADLSAHKNPINGSWVVSAVVDGYTVSVAYYYYTKNEAVRLFREAVNNGKR